MHTAPLWAQTTDATAASSDTASDDSADATTDQPAKKPAKKKAKPAATAPEKPVNANELMGAMRQTLENPLAPVAAPTGVPDVTPPSMPTVAAPAAPVGLTPEPPPPPKVVTPTPVPEVKKAQEKPAATPAPAKPVAPPAAAKVEEKPTTPSTPAPTSAPAVKVEEKPAAPTASAVTAPTTAAPSTPASAASSNGPPLLTDMQEAPNVLGGPMPDGAPPGTEEKPAASAATPAQNYAAPRPLFSKKGEKRVGVTAKAPEQTPAPSVMETPAPAKTEVEAPPAPAKAEAAPPAKAEVMAPAKAEVAAPPKESLSEKIDAPTKPVASEAAPAPDLKKSAPEKVEPLPPPEAAPEVTPEPKKAESAPAPKAPAKKLTKKAKAAAAKAEAAALKEKEEATAVPAPAPPLPAMPVLEPSTISPNTASGGMHGPPPVAEIDGSTLYSQKAGEASAPAVTTEEKAAMPTAVKSDAMPEVKAMAAPVPVASGSSSRSRASCGAANGVGTATRPTGNLCTEGTPSEVSGQAPWNWNCTGENGGGSVSCSAPLLVNGDCGLANGSQLASAPLTAQLCTAGKASDVTGKGPWYWNCFGENGGVVAQCSAHTLITGACGVASHTASSRAPTTGLCNSGKPSTVTGSGPWAWNCVGSGEGMITKCTSSVRRDGVCGLAATAGAGETPTENLCAAGVPSKVSGKGPWTWSCKGENGGLQTNCTAAVMTNAACGPAHGVGMAARPTNGLCKSGQPSDVEGDGPWTWTCLGENGGVRTNCMAPRKIDGACGTADNKESDDAPAANLCTSGAPGPVIGSGPWQWTCQGAGSGITVNCRSQLATPPMCGPAHGVGSPTSPGSGLCTVGTPTSVLGGGSGPWLWSCQDASGNHTVNCMAPMQVNGTCGKASEQAASEIPSTDLCRTGTASGVSGNGPWNWNCEGAGGGITVSCHVEMQAAPPPESASPVADVPPPTATAGNECTPTVKRWTITCQQGGYPATYAGVIVGETQVLCPTGVERGVWLSNSCAPATTQPVSPSPGVLLTPPPPKIGQMLPDVTPLPAKKLQPPQMPSRLATPRFKDLPPEVAGAPASPAAVADTSIVFAAGAEGLDGTATAALDRLSTSLQGNTRSIITLNAYAAMPTSNDQQEARRLSLARALAVRSYLMSRGIANNRIDVRALGPAGDNNGDDRVDITVAQ